MIDAISRTDGALLKALSFCTFLQLDRSLFNPLSKQCCGDPLQRACCVGPRYSPHGIFSCSPDRPFLLIWWMLWKDWKIYSCEGVGFSFSSLYVIVFTRLDLWVYFNEWTDSGSTSSCFSTSTKRKQPGVYLGLVVSICYCIFPLLRSIYLLSKQCPCYQETMSVQWMDAPPIYCR